MAKVERFEDLIAWQKARALASAIYRASYDVRFVNDRSFGNQIRRAAVSVVSNIAEGYERSTASDFAHFVFTAKSSCAEIRAQLYVASDLGYLDPSTLKQLMAQAEEVSRILGGLRSSLKKKTPEDRHETLNDSSRHSLLIADS